MCFEDMPRPKKQRNCECGFHGQAFKPVGRPMSELEVLRLCDLEGMVQEEAGQRMGVSRGTAQRLLASARKKTAQALVEGAALVFTEE